jgi:hypothetical protein
MFSPYFIYKKGDLIGERLKKKKGKNSRGWGFLWIPSAALLL